MESVLLLRAYRGDCMWELWDLGEDMVSEVLVQDA